jgi:hypothetical protein
MSQTVRMSALMMIVDPALGSQELLLQRPMVEQARTTTIKAAVSQTITTVEAAIAIGNVTAPGEAVLWNNESNAASTTYISVGFTEGATFYEAFRLGPNDFAKVPLSPDRTWQAKTNASTADLAGYILQRNP